jgi:hypothetical protein
MTRDDIIRMAREAGLPAGYDDQLENFAALVAAAERKACSDLCESRNMGDNNREDMEAKRCAAAIRARSNNEPQ